MATILVVEDYPVTQRVLALQLTREGHEVLQATNGFEALDQLALALPDLVLLDIAMPDMDGMTLLRQLRADERTQGLPVIMLTASGQDLDRRTANELAVADFLSKPVSSRELIESVNRALDEAAR